MELRCRSLGDLQLRQTAVVRTVQSRGALNCVESANKITVSFYSACNASNAHIASAVLAMAIPSVCPSATRRYCVKTTARSTVQFALSDSKMCLVFEKLKNIPEGWPLFLKSWLKLTHPSKSSELWQFLPCSASTERASEKSWILTNRKSYTGFPTSH